MNNGFPAGNPIANIFVIVVGAVAIAAFLVLSLFAFAIVGGLVLVLASVIGVRVWWLKRKLRGQVHPNPADQHAGKSGVIEGEYQVVADDREGE